MGKLKIEDKWMVFAVTGLANFVSAFTTSSINLALPSMAQDFGASMGTISWVSLIFMLSLSCTLMMFGRLGDLYGYKFLFVNGFALFAIISFILPILSVNLPLLIFFRFLLGIGSSMQISVTYALVSSSFPVEERGKALGINAIFVSIGLASGPSLGGWLLTHFNWHALFYINVPLSILGILASKKYIKTTGKKLNTPKMDWLGAVAFGIMIFALSIGINFVDDWGLLSTNILICAVMALLGLLAFIYIEKRQKDPLMELSLFKNKKFTLSITASLFSYLAQMMTNFLMPFYLVDILLYSQDVSGLIMLSTPIIMMISSPWGGRLTDRLGSKRPAIIGLMSVGLGSALMSQLNLDSSIVFIMLALAFFGLGNGFSVSAINTSIICSIPPEHTGVASGMSSTVRNLGQSLGVAVGGMLIALRINTYTNAGSSLQENAIYLLAQRDTFFFGVVVALIALISIASIPDVKACGRQ